MNGSGSGGTDARPAARARAAFFGSPAEALPILAGLVSEYDVAVVVTQPDRPQGRGRRILPSPVSGAARAWGKPVVHDVDDAATELRRVDVAVVAAYGRLIPGRLLEVPRRGFVNVHFSLLPRWRGASPVVRAILAGDQRTGVTLMQMDAGLDTGPILAREEVRIRPWDTGGTLTARLAALGADMVARHLEAIVSGALTAVPQDDSAATAAGKVSVEEAFVDPRRHRVDAVERALRAFHPRPGAWSLIDGTRIKLLAALPDTAAVEPGTLRMVDDRVVLGAVGGSLRLLRLQPEGRPAMDAAAWMHGRRGRPAVLGE
jgi:methionyl-tRNA formyltransferase